MTAASVPGPVGEDDEDEEELPDFHVDGVTDEEFEAETWTEEDDAALKAQFCKLDGGTAAEIEPGIDVLIIMVEGKSLKRPPSNVIPPGDEDDVPITSFTKRLRRIFDTGKKVRIANGLYLKFQVVNYQGSNLPSVPEDIAQTIRSFRRKVPKGILIGAGHSMGGANLIAANRDFCANFDLLITLDPESDSDIFDYRIYDDVENLINYRANAAYGFVGAEDVEFDDGVNGVNRYVNVSHEWIDNYVRTMVQQDIEFFLTHYRRTGTDPIKLAKDRTDQQIMKLVSQDKRSDLN